MSGDASYAWKRFVTLKFGVDTADVQKQVQGATESIAVSASAATDSAVAASAKVAAGVASAGVAVAGMVSTVSAAATTAFGFLQSGYAAAEAAAGGSAALIKDLYLGARVAAGGAAAGVAITGVAAGVAASQIKDMTEAAIAHNLALYDTSSKLSASALEAMSTIGRATGTTIEDIDSGSESLRKFVKSANDAKSLTRADDASFLKSLGLDAKRLKEMEPEQQMTLIALSLDKYSDGSRKAAAAQKLFGEEGDKLIPFLKNLGAETDFLSASISKQADENIKGLALMGQAYTRNMDDASAAVKRWWDADWFGSLKPITDAFIPAFYELSAVLKALVDEFTTSSHGGKLLGDEIKSVADYARDFGLGAVQALANVADGMHGLYTVAKVALSGVGAVYRSTVDMVSMGGEVIAKALSGDFAGAKDAAKAMAVNQSAIYEAYGEQTDKMLMHSKSWGTSMREVITSTISHMSDSLNKVPKYKESDVVDPKVLAALEALKQKSIDVGKAFALIGVQQDATQNEALNTLKLQSDTDYQTKKLELAQRTYDIEREYIVSAIDANNKAMSDKRLGQEEIYKIGQKQLDLGLQLAKAEQTLGAATTARWVALRLAEKTDGDAAQRKLDEITQTGIELDKFSEKYLQDATEKVAKETYLASIANESATTQKLLTAEYGIQLATKKELQRIADLHAPAEDKALAAARVRNAESVAMAGASAAAAREQAAGLETMVSGVLTTIVTDGDAAWRKLGESFSKHVMSQLIAMASKAFIVNIVGNVSSAGAGGAGGAFGGNSLMSMAGNALGGIDIGGSTLGAWGGGISSGFSAGLGGNAASFMGPTLPGFEAGAALAEAVPYVAAAYAAYKVIDSFSDKNVKKGGNYAYDVASGAVTQGITGTNGVELGNAQSQTLIQDGIKAATATTNALLKAAGSSVTVLGGEGMAQWSSEKPESYAGASLKTSTGVVAGKTFAQVDNNLGMASVETVIAKYAQSLNEATADAIIKVTDIPESAKTAIGKIDTTLGAEAFASAVQSVIETSRAGALAIERFGESGAAVSTQLAAAWLGFDAAGLGKMMTDAAFNPAVGMTAAETFGVALGNSVQQSLLNNVMGQVQAGIYNSIVLPILAGQQVSQAATDAVVADAVAKLDKLAALLGSESFKDVIDRIAASTAPVLASLSQFAPVQQSIVQSAPAAAAATNALSTAVKEITPAEKAAEESLRNLNNTLGGLADKNASLQVDLLRAQGDDVGALALQRKQDLERLTKGMGEADAAKVAAQYNENVALEDKISAIKSNSNKEKEISAIKSNSNKEKEISKDTTSEVISNQQKIADEAKSAAKTMLESWQTITGTLEDEVERIRGVMSAGTTESVAALQAKFITATAAARAGDVEAAKSLPSISQALLQAADETVTDTSRLAVLRGQVAASLEQTAMDSKTSAQQRYDSAIQAADRFQLLQSAPIPAVQEYTPIVIAPPVAAPAQTSPAPAIDKPLQAMADAITVLTDTLTNRPITVRAVDY